MTFHEVSILLSGPTSCSILNRYLFIYILCFTVECNEKKPHRPHCLKQNVYIFTSYSLSKLQFGLNPQMHFWTCRQVTCDITKQLGQKTQSSSATKSLGSLYFKLQIQHRKPSLPLITGNGPPTMPSSDILGYGNGHHVI